MEDLTTTYPCPDCAENCDDFVMPEVVSEDCPDTIELELSELKNLFAAQVDPSDKTKPLGGPTDWTLKSDWDTAIDNTAAGKVRRMYGIGDVPEPEAVTVTVHDDQKKVLYYKYIVNFDIQNMHQTNYEALRKFQCGAKLRIWYLDRGDYLYGGQDGIPATIVKGVSPNERGAESYKSIKLQLEFKAKCDPDRTASPWAEPIAA